VVVLAGVAVAVRFGLSAIELRVTPGPHPSTVVLPSGIDERLRALNLGSPSTLADARSRASFPVRLPAGLGAPDRVYVRDIDGAVGVMVSLVYEAVPGWPPPATTGVAVLITESPGHVDRPYMTKLINGGAQVTPVVVDGEEGYWIAGTHDFLFLHPTRPQTSIQIHLAGETLIWEANRVAFRIEAGGGMEAAISLGNSLAP
ncbi:MAG: hypothetical protein M3301_05235, partial [Chloroflexota bacterium]|nr:hypothetical protein [Chloroflexota bacterium]